MGRLSVGAVALATLLCAPLANAASHTASITEFAFTPGAGALAAAAGLLAFVGRRRDAIERSN